MRYDVLCLKVSDPSIMDPGGGCDKAQPPVFPHEILHVSALVVVIQLQKHAPGHAVRQFGKVIEGSEDPGASY